MLFWSFGQFLLICFFIYSSSGFGLLDQHVFAVWDYKWLLVKYGKYGTLFIHFLIMSGREDQKFNYTFTFLLKWNQITNRGNKMIKMFHSLIQTFLFWWQTDICLQINYFFAFPFSSICVQKRGNEMLFLVGWSSIMSHNFNLLFLTWSN